MHIALAILFLSYVTFMYFAGFFGWVKAKPFKFSDKVDLFYVEPRQRNSEYSSGHVRVRHVDRQSRTKPRLKQQYVAKLLPGKSLPVRTNIKPKGCPSSQRAVEAKPTFAIERDVFKECVAALRQLGYGTNVHCKHIVSKHANSVSNKITSCESFLESFLKLESSNESQHRSTS